MKSGQAKLAQPSANRAFVHGDGEAPDHLLAQINAAPAYHVVDFRIGAGKYQFTQFGHLRLGQFGRCARRGARFQALNPGRVVAMHPVAQSLPIHASLPRGIQPRHTLQHHSDRQ